MMKKRLLLISCCLISANALNEAIATNDYDIQLANVDKRRNMFQQNNTNLNIENFYQYFEKKCKNYPSIAVLTDVTNLNKQHVKDIIEKLDPLCNNEKIMFEIVMDCVKKVINNKNIKQQCFFNNGTCPSQM